MRHATRVQAALARLPEVDPGIAGLALWCSFRDGAGPTATQGEVIHIGPEFTLLPISEQTGLIAHHVLHVALRHSARRAGAAQRFGAGFRPDRFDLACDALINEMLLQAGHAVPRPAVRAAEIVALLPAADRPDNVLADWDCTQLYTAMAGAQRVKGGADDDPVARYAAAQGFKPDLQGSDPDTSDAAIWAGRVEQALSAGSGIGALLTRLGDLPRPVVPWDIRLRRLLHKALADRPTLSHRRPARAWLARDALARQTGGAQPVFAPALIRDSRRPRVVVGLDTSSSIPDLTLDLFAAEAAAIIRRTGAEGHLLGFDTAIHTQRRFDRAQTLTGLALTRGGGTDFDAVMIAANALDPSMIILLTDLDAGLTVTPAAPLLWAVPAAPRIYPAVGEVLVMDDNP